VVARRERKWLSW